MGSTIWWSGAGIDRRSSRPVDARGLLLDPSAHVGVVCASIRLLVKDSGTLAAQAIRDVGRELARQFPECPVRKIGNHRVVLTVRGTLLDLVTVADGAALSLDRVSRMVGAVDFERRVSVEITDALPEGEPSVAVDAHPEEVPRAS